MAGGSRKNKEGDYGRIFIRKGWLWKIRGSFGGKV